MDVLGVGRAGEESGSSMKKDQLNMLDEILHCASSAVNVTHRTQSRRTKTGACNNQISLRKTGK